MCAADYNLRKTPFDRTSRPEYIWLGKAHAEALAAIKREFLAGRGLFSITGNTGSGKTALVKRLLSELTVNKVVVTVTDPDLSQLDFFNWLSIELKLNVIFKSKGAFLTRFKKYLLDAFRDGVRIILVIDDAHRINQDLLKDLMIFASVEKDGKKLISILFVGQPGFNELLHQEQNQFLASRLSLNYHLQPLSKDELIDLISHRLRVAGAEANIFSPQAYNQIFRYSAGYPGAALNICGRALAAGSTRSVPVIDGKLINECAEYLQLAGIEGETVGAPYHDGSSDSMVSAEQEFSESRADIRQAFKDAFSFKIFPVNRTSIMALFLACLAIAFFLIYQFKPDLPSWASLTRDLGQLAYVQKEPTSLNRVRENRKSSPAIVSNSVSDHKTSLPADEPQAASRGGDDAPADSKIFGKSVSARSEIEALPEAPAGHLSMGEAQADDPSGIKSASAPLVPLNSVEQDPQMPPKEAGTHKDQVVQGASEGELERQSADQDYAELSHRLFSELKPLEEEHLEPNVTPVLPAPETEKAGIAPPAPDLSVSRVDPLPPAGKSELRPAAGSRPAAEIKMIHLEPPSEQVSVRPPGESRPEADAHPFQAPPNSPGLTLESPRRLGAISKQPANDIDSGKNVGSLQPEPGDTAPQVPPPLKSDLDSTEKPPRKTGLEIAKLNEKALKEDTRRRLQAFLDTYCKTYEEKNLDRFSTFFTPDARENNKPFHTLLPVYRQNFAAIDRIYYRIELQDFVYDSQNSAMRVEGKFYLEWLPQGSEWRRNSGKIFMELNDSGASYKVRRLDYYGERRR